ncbi:hypothetical protein K431DRAFT_77704 [Polychaeton citri CBS 116435]|uniref:Uncharacterized protein n=1 Tax=Polychaeton citri CBS 116435 TaxID=1314669 RepID=A0A9P4QDU4_9PEZI|nr:hypothetical protein K431DRAFT_77704 [Polychaeton citri CBS 116435]
MHLTTQRRRQVDRQAGRRPWTRSIVEPQGAIGSSRLSGLPSASPTPYHSLPASLEGERVMASGRLPVPPVPPLVSCLAPSRPLLPGLLPEIAIVCVGSSSRQASATSTTWINTVTIWFRREAGANARVAPPSSPNRSCYLPGRLDGG